MAVNQQQLEKAGIYEATSTLPSLLADLDVIDGMAETVNLRKKQRSRLAGFVMLGGLIAAIVGGVVFTPLLVLGILDIIIGFIVWISSYFIGGKVTAHPVRLNMAKQRITMIQEDASAKAPFAFRLALSSNATQISNDKWSGRRNGNQEFLEECWFSLEGPLLDGTVLTDEVKDLTRKRTFSNARGKRKTKVRLQHLVNVRFSYPKEVYGDARSAGQALHKEVKVGKGAMLRNLRVTEKAIAMKAVVTTDKEILNTAGMLSVGGYRILNLARKMAAGQRGKAQ